MQQEPDITGAFYERVRRHVRDALRAYRDELTAVLHEMAARGLANSGPHLRRRVDVLAKWTQVVADQCFDDVARLPGTQSMHRIVHADFFADQLHDFFRQAEGDVLFRDFGSGPTNEVKRLIGTIRDGLEHDLRDFQAGLWRPRSRTQEPSVTNTVNIHGPNMGSVQQAGDGAMQSTTVNLNAAAIQIALEQFVVALNQTELPGEVRGAVMAEVETIRPQLKKATPNAVIIREGGRSIRNILEGVVSGVLASALWAFLTAAGAH